MSAGDAVADAYAALARRAWVRNRARADELTHLIEEWRTTAALPDERRERVRELAHSLRGSAGTFGHDHAAQAAEALEELLVSGGPPRLDTVADMVAMIHLGLVEPPAPELLGEDADGDPVNG